jgi:hypothetical protein
MYTFDSLSKGNYTFTYQGGDGLPKNNQWKTQGVLAIQEIYTGNGNKFKVSSPERIQSLRQILLENYRIDSIILGPYIIQLSIRPKGMGINEAEQAIEIEVPEQGTMKHDFDLSLFNTKVEGYVENIPSNVKKLEFILSQMSMCTIFTGVLYMLI